MAEEWIGARQGQFESGKQGNFAITLRSNGTLVGGISMDINRTDEHGKLGYYIGKPYWNNGYATEATQAVIKYSFEVLGLRRVFAAHFARNPASGRVMQKAGMSYEGCLRQHVKKCDACRRHDVLRNRPRRLAIPDPSHKIELRRFPQISTAAHHKHHSRHHRYGRPHPEHIPVGQHERPSLVVRRPQSVGS